jgi:hypothetical protein
LVLKIAVSVDKVSYVSSFAVDFLSVFDVRQPAFSAIALQSPFTDMQHKARILNIKKILVFVEYLIRIDKRFQVFADFGQILGQVFHPNRKIIVVNIHIVLLF